MTLRRTYLICSLLGLGLLSACDDTEEPTDSGVFPVLPGGMSGGTGGVAGTQGGVAGTQGGISGTQGGISGTQGGISGTQGGISGTQGGISGTQGGISGTQGGISGTQGGISGTQGGISGTQGGISGTQGGMQDGGVPNRDGGAPGGADTGAPVVSAGACTPPPSKTFTTTVWEPGGPSGDYTVIRPTTLGEGGFMHPPIAWGNGVTTVPSLYTELLDNLAKQGFVVIADPGLVVSASVVREGLEWLIAQGTGSGKFAGKLAANCAGTIGYSMGGGSAVGAGAHAAVKAVVSMHGLQDAAGAAKGPILLTTSEGDGFVTKDQFVVPCYNASTKQPTMLASHTGGDHLDPLGNGGPDAEPAIAWLRYWIYGDQSKKDFFFGANCKLCSWPDVRRKNHPEWTTGR